MIYGNIDKFKNYTEEQMSKFKLAISGGPMIFKVAEDKRIAKK